MARTKHVVEAEETFGRRLARLRKEAGYSQQSLAAEIGISNRMVAYYEAQTERPPAHLLTPIADALGLTVDQLLGRAPISKRKAPQNERLIRQLRQVEKLPALKESLFAYLREADVIRVRDEGLISETSMRNPLRQPIFDAIDAGQPWVALRWRHYMWWFADFEGRLARGEADPRFLLQQAENNWLLLQDRDVLFEEPRNNGRWIRPWRQALADFRKISA